jgi:cell division protein FtsB
VSTGENRERGKAARNLLRAAAVLLVLLLAIAGAQSYRDLAVARAREEQLAARAREMEERIAALRRQIERLRNDPRALERLAREELGLTYPQDMVIVLPPEPQPTPASPTALTP